CRAGAGRRRPGRRARGTAHRGRADASWLPPVRIGGARPREPVSGGRAVAEATFDQSAVETHRAWFGRNVQSVRTEPDRAARRITADGPDSSADAAILRAPFRRS